MRARKRPGCESGPDLLALAAHQRVDRGEPAQLFVRLRAASQQRADAVGQELRRARVEPQRCAGAETKHVRRTKAATFYGFARLAQREL